MIVGGSGWDYLEGDDGNDILIGGTGSDWITGNGGEDILIGGSTDHDNDLGALATIFAEWNTGISLVDRINSLSGGLLSTGQVHDDSTRDWMVGGASSDWYFADLWGWDKDKLFGFDSWNDHLTVIV